MEQLFSLRAESPRYDRYEARIKRLARTLAWAGRHWLLLTLAVVLTAGAVVGFLLTMGRFTGSLSFETLVYGETPQCSIRAFLSDVHYQYAPVDGEGIFSDQLPTLPGEYRIRAVSKNGFGQQKYSDSITFTLLPRELQVQIHDGTFVYGSFSEDIASQTTQLTGLAGGDAARSAEYAAVADQQGNYTISLQSLQICNSAGQDVTACYRISSTAGYFTMTRRPIAVKSENAQKIYDGEIWDQARGSLAEGTLAGGDQLQISFSPAPAAAGRHLLEPNCVVINALGQDVTACYEITTQPGTLTVTPRPITVETGSAERQYNAQPLTNSQWSLVEGTLVEGHTIEGTTTGSRTIAGQSRNTILLKIFDADGADVTGNYDPTVKQGTLTVHPITLRFQTGSREKVYDGLALEQESWSRLSGTVLKGHTLTCRTTGTQTNAGSSANTLHVQIRDADGHDVTDEGYRIEVEYGTLTVTPRPLTVTSDSMEKLYDGYPLTYHSYTIDANAFGFGEWNQYIIRTHFTGSQREVGSSPNTFTVEIGDSSGKITTSNYSITYIYGTLTVLENPNYTEDPSGGSEGGSTGDSESEGDPSTELMAEEILVGFPEGQTDYLYAQVKAYSGYAAAEQVYFRYMSYGDYTGSGWVKAQPYEVGEVSPLEFVGQSLRENAAIQIHRLNGCPTLLPYYPQRTNWSPTLINDCYCEVEQLTYNVDLATGYDYPSLKNTAVSSRLTNLEAQYRQFVHEQYLQIPDSTKQALLQWAAQNGIRADSPSLAEDIQSAIINSAAYNIKGAQYPDGVDVAVYFLTEAKEGICQHFATAATLMYRAFGIPARYTTGFVDTLQKGALVNLTSGDGHAWVEIYVDGLGWVPMEVTAGDLSGNVKTELYVQACDAIKYYDGKGFDSYDLAQYAILGGTLRPGHRLAVTIASPTAGTPGTYSNKISKCVVYDENGQDVTSKYYNIYISYGTLEILPRKIELTVASASKVYDGQPLACPEYWISRGSLAPGHRLDVVIEATLTAPGSEENNVAVLRILEEDPSGDLIDCTDCYDITIIPGELTVTAPESG